MVAETVVRRAGQTIVNSEMQSADLMARQSAGLTVVQRVVERVWNEAACWGNGTGSMTVGVKVPMMAQQWVAHWVALMDWN